MHCRGSTNPPVAGGQQPNGDVPVARNCARELPTIIRALQATAGNRSVARYVTDQAKRTTPGHPLHAVVAREQSHYLRHERERSRARPGVAVQAGPEFRHDVYLADFNPGSAALRPEHVRLLSRLLNGRLAEPATSISIVGYTDAVDHEAVNAPLRQRRADAVREYLQRHGIPAAVIHAAGARAGERLTQDADEASRAINRGVVVQVDRALPPREPAPAPLACPPDGGLRDALDVIGATTWAQTSQGRAALAALEQVYVAGELRFDATVRDPHAAESHDPHDMGTWPYGPTGSHHPFDQFYADHFDGPYVHVVSSLRCQIGKLAVFLAHEGVHLARRGEPLVLEEVHCVLAQRDVYAELLQGVLVWGRRVDMARDRFLDVVVNESQHGRTIDIVVAQQYPFNSDWVVRSFNWWGGPRNRWLRTLEEYLMALLGEGSLTEYFHAERIVAILEAVPGNTVGPAGQTHLQPFNHLVGRVGLQRLRERLTPLYQSNRLRPRLEALEQRTELVLHLP